MVKVFNPSHRSDQDRELIEVARCMIADGKEENSYIQPKAMKDGGYGKRIMFEVFIPEEADNG